MPLIKTSNPDPYKKKIKLKTFEERVEEENDETDSSKLPYRNIIYR